MLASTESRELPAGSRYSGKRKVDRIDRNAPATRIDRRPSSPRGSGVIGRSRLPSLSISVVSRLFVPLMRPTRKSRQQPDASGDRCWDVVYKVA